MVATTPFFEVAYTHAVFARARETKIRLESNPSFAHTGETIRSQGDIILFKEHIARCGLLMNVASVAQRMLYTTGAGAVVVSNSDICMHLEASFSLKHSNLNLKMTNKKKLGYL